MHWLALLMAVLAGALISMQAPINAALGRGIGTIAAVCVSFGIGFGAMLIFAMATGRLGGLGGVAAVPWWQWLGGILGAAFVVASTMLVTKLGVTQLIAGAVTGQLLAALVIDHFGWLGVPVHSISWQRVLALPLMALALWLSRR